MKTHSTIVIAALALLALTAAARPADAARLDIIGDVLDYTDTSTSPGIANALTITFSVDRYTIDDPAESAIDLTSNALAAGCTAVDSNTVTCPESAIASITVLTRNGDDRVMLTGVEVPAFIDGGHGDDSLVGGDADDFFFWQPGDGSDRIAGGRGIDILDFAGSNVDEQITITTDGTGFDLVRDVGNVRMAVHDIELLSVFTGEGTDSVVTTPLVDTIQDIEDGVGEPDGLADVLHVDAGQRCLTRRNDTFEVDGRTSIAFTNFPEVLVENELCPSACDDAFVSKDCTVNHVRHQPCQGTAGDDLIVGTAAADVIRGGGGNDRIVGRGGDDLLCGEDGADVLLGGPGDDTLVGGPGGDRLDGGSGNDTLEGDGGDDVLSGGSGKDDLDGGADQDQLSGGANSDTLRGGAGVDTIDGGASTDLCTDADQPGPFIRCEQP